MVYFGLVDNTHIKIGETADIDTRLKQHKATKNGIATPFSELCVLRGSPNDEKSVHSYFRRHLLPNEIENFHAHEDIVDYIRWLRDQYYVWVPDDMDDARNDDAGMSLNEKVARLDEITADFWLPSPERRKAGPKQRSLIGDEFGILNLPPRETCGDDFYTNPLIIDAARNVLGGRIDLDPASHAVANRNVRATTFYSKNNCGLANKWRGRVWCNPPFSEWQHWVPKIVSEVNSGDIEAMCLLCATRTLTAQYFAPIHTAFQAMCILRGRIPFWGARAGTPDDGHAVFYFGPDEERFCKEFSTLGKVWTTP